MLVLRPTPSLLCFAIAAAALAQPPLQVTPAADGSYLGITSKDGRPLRFTGSGLGGVAVPQTPAQEGTLSFFFTPDWSPGDCTTHWLLELKGEGLLLAFRKGYDATISPEYCYLFTDPEGGTAGFHCENLFRGRERHHYAIRWSTAKERVQFVVDGEAAGRAGKFRFAGPVTIPAVLTLYNMACGTFDDIRLYSEYLSVPEITALAGRKQPARYLQSQPPPDPRRPQAAANEAPVQSTTRPVVHEYVDPATGKIATTLDDDQKELLPAYNPAEYPNLPTTPHTKWARPLADGKLRILLVATHGFYDEYSMIREAAELWQRLDCEILVTNKPDPRVMSQDFDVIAVSIQGFTNGRWAGWSDIDDALREWIVQRVNSGKSGLVWAYPIAPDKDTEALFAQSAKLPSGPLLRGFPAEALPQPNSPDGRGAFRWDQVYTVDDSFFMKPQDAENLAQLYRGPTGRSLVKLNFVNASWYPNMGLTADTALNAAATDVSYDDYMALAARAMLLAAGREPSCQITDADVRGSRWTVTLSPGADLAELNLSVRARDMWGRSPIPATIVPASPTVTIKGVQLPPCATVDFVLRDPKGNAIDWFIATVPPAIDPRIADIKLDRDYYSPGQPVKATVSVQATQPTACAVELYLTDHQGRRLRKAPPVKLTEGSAELRLAIPTSSASLLMRVEAQLLVNGVLADTRSADVPVPETEPRGFYAFLYGTMLNRLCVRARQTMFRDDYGVRGGFHQGAHSYANLAARNLAAIEYGAYLGYPSQPSDCEEFAEDWETNYTTWLAGDAAKMPPYRPLFYSLGEEHYVLMGSCPTPTANAKFREWLKGKYGTLERLNGVWGSAYADWDEISMITPEIVDMLKIQFDVVRFENRRFMEHLFAERHAFVAEHFRRTDPSGRTGIHAGWDLWMGRGYDYWLLSRGMEDMMCYGGPHNHYARSFFQRYYGSHYHYNIGSHENVRWHPWYMVLSGAHGWSWYTDAPQIWGSTVADMQLTSDWLAGADEFKAAVDAGQLLTRVKYLDDQVAIHYSQDSFQAGASNLTWIHQRFVNLCFDTGTPFRFVSYAQVEQGDLLKRVPRLLILPHSIALSEAECMGLRDYVAAGGVLWADIMPGTYNNFGQKLEQSRLADLFDGLEDSETHAGLKARMGPVGKGFVVLADPGNYSYDRNVGDYASAARLFDTISRLAHLDCPAQPLKANGGGLANGIWTAAWANGSAVHIAAAKDYQRVDQEPARVVFRLSRGGHVYEMRSGKYLGHVDHDLPATMKPTEGQVFTILAYRVKALSVSPTRKAVEGQDLPVKVVVVTDGAVGRDDLNVLQVRVTGPDGIDVTALRRTVEMRGDSHTFALPVAYNDQRGKWTVAVRDLATGLTARCSYTR